MSPHILTTEDILQVAKTISISLNQEEIERVREAYPEAQAQDPEALWNLVVEQCIYFV